MIEHNNKYRLNHLNNEEIIKLCTSLREEFIQTILETGGHFAGNLGVVELTTALLANFAPPKDSIIWDVGHQSYIYKMLTGRRDSLHTIRQKDGLSGFPKMDESDYDAFGTGHSSTALSASLGIATAKFLRQDSSKTIAIVGDGALTGGMVWEALNNIPKKTLNLIIIINDNHIGIDPNTGNIDAHLQNIKNYAANIFDNFGIKYTGPIDGHNIPDLMKVLSESKEQGSPQIIHIKTVKGKGYEPAEKRQTQFHARSKYVKINKHQPAQKKWQDVFGECLVELAKTNEKIVAITPAMPSGSGLNTFMKLYPERSFDVGIAEQHALTFAAGMATHGYIPFVNIYSTFLQRAYDQLIHDIALQNLPVVIAVDRAGLVGEDGPTHHGVFDLSYLLPIPNLIITAPANEEQFRFLLEQASITKSPFIIRYPKGNILNKISLSTSKKTLIEHRKGRLNLVISIGNSSSIVSKITDYDFTWIQPLYLKPLPIEEIISYISNHSNVVIIEDGSLKGGIGEFIKSKIQETGIKSIIHTLGIKDQFVSHGSIAELHEECGFSETDIIKCLKPATS
ncbi:1-deoxy-D-xylulose-5-phosphate synthase [Bacteroidia bacterium]|nr:1-deoxy-D-xylulose-5-phosphate synthase [Bacteroidia bacterium]